MAQAKKQHQTAEEASLKQLGADQLRFSAQFEPFKAHIDAQAERDDTQLMLGRANADSAMMFDATAPVTAIATGAGTSAALDNNQLVVDANAAMAMDAQHAAQTARDDRIRLAAGTRAGDAQLSSRALGEYGQMAQQRAAQTQQMAMEKRNAVVGAVTTVAGGVMSNNESKIANIAGAAESGDPTAIAEYKRVTGQDFQPGAYRKLGWWDRQKSGWKADSGWRQPTKPRLGVN